MIDIKSIPDALKDGENWPLLDIDPDWMWLAYDQEERIVGMLLAAPCHGLAFLWRVRMLPSAPRTALLSLLRRFIKDIRARGCLGYMVMLDVTREKEQALCRIAFRAGAKFVPGAVSVIAGSISTGHLGEGER
jgi:hypothetical protein